MRDVQVTVRAEFHHTAFVIGIRLRHRQEQALADLQQALDLPAPPSRIECYDISNIRGTSAVGSMVAMAGMPGIGMTGIFGATIDPFGAWLAARGIITLGLRVERQATARLLATYGPFAATERLLMELVKRGGDRQDLHERIRRCGHNGGFVLAPANVIMYDTPVENVVAMFDAATAPLGEMIDAIERADSLLLGTPTINAKAPKPIFDLISSLVLLNVRGKKAAVFGCYGWSGEAVKMVEEILRNLKFEILQDGLRQKMAIRESDLEQCRTFGNNFALSLQGIWTGEPAGGRR